MAATPEAVPSTKTVDNQTETTEADAARELVRMAEGRGPSLTGPDGLLKMLTKTVIETALDEELTGHLGYERHDAEPRSISRCGMIFGPRSRERSGFFTAIRPMSSSGCAMVLSGGFTCSEVDVLSKPTTETSSGTRSPRHCSSLTTAAPISSLIAKIAVRTGSCCSSSSTPAAPFVEEAAGGGDGRAFSLGHGAEVAALAGLGHVDRSRIPVSRPMRRRPSRSRWRVAS
jgi:hypothetical protein